MTAEIFSGTDGMLVPKEILSGSGERLRYLLNPSIYHRGHVTC